MHAFIYLDLCISRHSQLSGDAVAGSEQGAGQRLVIWGTDVNVGTCKEKFQVWLQSVSLQPSTAD